MKLDLNGNVSLTAGVGSIVILLPFSKEWTIQKEIFFRFIKAVREMVQFEVLSLLVVCNKVESFGMILLLNSEIYVFFFWHFLIFTVLVIVSFLEL